MVLYYYNNHVSYTIITLIRIIMSTGPKFCPYQHAVNVADVIITDSETLDNDDKHQGKKSTKSNAKHAVNVIKDFNTDYTTAGNNNECLVDK